MKQTGGTILLTTERLILRRYTLEDAVTLHQLFGIDRKMFEYTGWNPYETAEKARDTVQNSLSEYENPHFYGWAIESEGQLTGTIGAYDYDPEHSRIEVGGSIARLFWGRGFASEALHRVLIYLTTEEQIRTVTAWCAADNAASGKVMEKAGMLLNRVEKNALTVENRVFDKAYFEYYSVK